MKARTLERARRVHLADAAGETDARQCESLLLAFLVVFQRAPDFAVRGKADVPRTSSFGRE